MIKGSSLLFYPHDASIYVGRKCGTCQVDGVEGLQVFDDLNIFLNEFSYHVFPIINKNIGYFK